MTRRILFAAMAASLATMSAGCFASRSPVGGSDAVAPEIVLNALTPRARASLEARVEADNVLRVRLNGANVRVRLYPCANGFVAEALPGAMGIDAYVYGYLRREGPVLAVYADDFSSVAAARGQRHAGAARARQALPVIEEEAALISLGGGFQAYRPMSIEAAARSYDALIATGALEPHFTLALATTNGGAR